MSEDFLAASFGKGNISKKKPMKNFKSLKTEEVRRIELS